MTNKRKQWTTEEDTRLTARSKELTTIGVNGLPCVRRDAWEILATEHRRPVNALKHRLGDLKRAEGIQQSYRPRAAAKPRQIIHTAAERTARQAPLFLPHHQTITGYVFGDPLPGRSALDKKREGTHA